MEYLEEMTRRIAYRKGLGDVLAEGVRRAAERLGKEAEKERLDVKGLELPAYDPRGTYGMALAYATADRGGCHLRAWAVAEDAFGELDPFNFEDKAKLVKDLQDLNSVKWSLIICDFWLSSFGDMARLLKPALGKEFMEKELRIIGERIWNLSKLFNAREGFRREHDTLPYRVFNESLKGGKTVPREEFEKSLTEYYRLKVME